MNNLVVAVGDCTGHGVPGGFMTMLGLSLLDEITRSAEVKTPAETLDLMREQVRRALKQDNHHSMKDGMDLALCAINLDTYKMQYSGANVPLLIFKNEKLNYIKPDKQPVSAHVVEKPFTNHIIDIEEKDRFYMSSDGYKDQFNENDERFKRNRFYKLLEKIQNIRMSEQVNKLEDVFVQWKGSQEQIDDVLVLGFEIDTKNDHNSNYKNEDIIIF